MKKNLFSVCLLMALALVMLAGCMSKSNDFPKYMAVQIDRGDGWSIIDDQGNILANGEYDAADAVSLIYGESYWVKSGGKFMLYSIKNPKKPVVNEEWDYATEMYDGRALVAKEGMPIHIIDEQGKTIAVLDKDITAVMRKTGFSDFFFKKSNGKYGWANKDGEIVKEGLQEIMLFDKSLVIALAKEDSKKYTIFDIQGNETGTFAADRTIGAANGFIGIIKNDKAYILDRKGDIVVSSNKYYALLPVSVNYCVGVKKDDKCALLDMKGDELIRAKYSDIYPAGNNMFYAVKDNGKVGVINDKDGTIVEFDYSRAISLGDNFLMQDGSTWLIIGQDSKRIGKEEFYRMASTPCDNAIFYSAEREYSLSDAPSVTQVEKVAVIEGDPVDEDAETQEILETIEFQSDDDGYDPTLSTRKLTAADLSGKSKKDLEIMRNSIYARYGYKFKRKDLLNYFSQFLWYAPSTSDMSAAYKRMSSIEKYNIEFINKHE